MGTTVDLEAADVSPRRGADRRESRIFNRVSKKAAAKAAIAERREEFEATMLSDKCVLSILSVVYGPKSKVDSLTLLEGVRMSSEAP